MSTDNSTSGSNTGGGDGSGSNTTLEFIGIAVFVGIALYFFIRYAHTGLICNWRERRPGAGGGGNAGGASPPRLGLAPSDIAALPTFVFGAVTNNGGAAKRKGNGPNGAECPVCLADVEEGEVVRMLPSCRHFFHVQCIDVWLCSHTSCPVCRAATEPERIALGGAKAPPPLPQLRCRSSPGSSELLVEERSDEEAAPSPRLPELHRGGTTEASSAVTDGVGSEKVELGGSAVLRPFRQLRRCSTTGSSTGNGEAGPEEDHVKLGQTLALPALTLAELRRCSSTGSSILGDGRRRIIRN